MVAVGSISSWHGWDRLLRGLHVYEGRRSQLDPTVEVTFVGDGPARTSLQVLADDLGLTRRLTFVGLKFGKDLDAVFKGADVGIGTLAAHRKLLSQASSLKSREYCARGLPFVSADHDPAFEGVDFVFRAPSDESSLDIRSIVGWLSALGDTGPLNEKIRRYAVDHCDAATLLMGELEATHLKARAAGRGFTS